MIRQRYLAKQQFEAANPISGRRRRVQPGELFFADLWQQGQMIVVELDESLWLLDRDTFERCCVASPAPAA